MVGHVLAPQLIVRRRRGGRELPVAERLRIASAVARRRDDDQRGRRRAVDERSLGKRIAPAAVGQDPHRRLERQAIVSGQPPDEIQPVGPPRHRHRILQAIDPRREGQAAGRVRGQADDDGLSRMGGEDFAGVPNAACAIADPRGRRVDVQFAAVVFNRRVVLERNPQVSERLVRLEARRPAHQLFLREGVRLDGRSREEEAADLGEVGERVRIVALARASPPQRLLVELDALATDRSEHHRAEPAVAERQRVIPLRRRAGVPQRQITRVVVDDSLLRTRRSGCGDQR